ncbi:MAG: transposase [Nanoarchaeota archaeon]|nr:transposase [Nanoarchaeota archaeon]
MIERNKIARSIAICRHFINGSFGLSLATHTLTGFELSEPLLDAAAYNTYIETIGNKADTIYAHAKNSLSEMMTHSYLDYIRRISEKFDWKSKETMLAFDYTDEDFYGEVQGLDIHGWKKGKGITGKFKFLTCSLISDEIPEKIPLISIPIQLGHNMSYAVVYCIKLVQPYIGPIKLILFDRGFYAKELMYDLKELNLPYLVLAKKGNKTKDKKESYIYEELSKMQKEEKKLISHEYEFNSNKTTYRFNSYLAFLKSIFSKRLDKELDWVFATNVEEIQLDEIIRTYRKRWRIETQFRVQDEATIKCKSKEMKIRYFLFLFEQLLQTQWVCFYKKEEVSFKAFLIEIHKVNKDLVANPRKSFGKA